MKGETPIRIQPGDAFGRFVADIVAGHRTFDALTGIDALAQDLDHIIREHPEELALTAAVLGGAFSGLNKGFENADGKAEGVVVAFRIGESGDFDSAGQTNHGVRVTAPEGITVTNNGGTRVFLYANGNKHGVAGSYKISIDYKQHRLIENGYSGQFSGSFELPATSSGSYVIKVALNTKEIEIIETN